MNRSEHQELKRIKRRLFNTMLSVAPKTQAREDLRAVHDQLGNFLRRHPTATKTEPSTPIKE